jgi:hypothetical protein
MTIRRSAISHDHLLRVGAVERCQRRDGRRPSDRLDDPPAGHIASAVRVAWPSSASRARIRSGPAARCSPSATEYPTRAATLASPFSSRCNTVNGRSQSGGGSRGRSRCASAGRIARTPTPRRRAGRRRGGRCAARRPAGPGAPHGARQLGGIAGRGLHRRLCRRRVRWRCWVGRGEGGGGQTQRPGCAQGGGERPGGIAAISLVTGALALGERPKAFRHRQEAAAELRTEIRLTLRKDTTARSQRLGGTASTRAIKCGVFGMAQRGEAQQ